MYDDPISSEDRAADVEQCASFDQPCDDPVHRSGLCYKHVVRACETMGESPPELADA